MPTLKSMARGICLLIIDAASLATSVTPICPPATFFTSTPATETFETLFSEYSQLARLAMLLIWSANPLNTEHEVSMTQRERMGARIIFFIIVLLC